MFRQRGKSRTFRQNLRLAAFLSFTAGLVNICGVLSVSVLTTNVTGHFAYFSEAMQKKDIFFALNFLYYILAFLLGSFTSSLLMEFYTLKGKTTGTNAAVFFEIALLLFVGFNGDQALKSGFSQVILACILLFAMGLQNSLVTRVSNASVRTTHLTGLFTDLGIELSQLFFYKEAGQRARLLNSIGLRSAIVAFFFLGCVCGGFAYHYIQLKTLKIAAGVLLVALIYDNLRVGFLRLFRKLKRDQSF